MTRNVKIVVVVMRVKIRFDYIKVFQCDTETFAGNNFLIHSE